MKAFDRRRILFLLGAGALAGAGTFATRAGAVCVGDCDGSGQVLIPEVQRCINLERGLTSEPCANADQDLNGTVEPDEVDLCLDAFLDAATCSMVFTPVAATSTPTAVPPTSTPTPSNSPTRTNTPTGVPPTNTSTPTQVPLNTATSTSTRTPTPTLTATPTRTGTPTATRTHTPTNTPVATCPIAAGIYTQTQTAGGALAVDGLTPFPFPSGGQIVQHVSAASAPDCVHNTVVPATGGFSAPLFCIPSLNFSVQVQQDGCGVGRIDSNGGSDFTITEVGDTSSPTICGLPASNCLTPPGDSNVQVNVQVGGNGADICSGGTANAAVSVPVHTITWSHVPLISCTGTLGGGPGPDTTGPGGAGDSTVTEFDQTLDFTTDSTSADWTDLDPDGCCLAGAGPGSERPCAFGGGGGGPVGDTGTCINLAGVNVAGPDVTTVAAGTIGSNGSPLYDLTFLTTLPNEVSGPTGAPSATCATPPGISFLPPGNIVTRCIP